MGPGFHAGASHDPGPGSFLTHDFQDMDGEPGYFTVVEGHGYPLVRMKTRLIYNMFSTIMSSVCP